LDGLYCNAKGATRRQLSALFALNRRILKVYPNLLKESLSELWDYTYEGATLRYLQSGLVRCALAAAKPDGELAQMLLDRLEGILNYRRTKIPMGVIEAVNGNLKALLRRGPRLARYELSAAEATAL